MQGGVHPDLRGCAAVGASVVLVKPALEAAIPFHLDGLRAGGEMVALPQSVVEWEEV